MSAREWELAQRGMRCGRCGEVIGVYEPLVHVIDGIAHKTSRAADPALADADPGTCFHLACSTLGDAALVAVE